MGESALKQLARMTTLVADTGDIERGAAHRPTDATTNPSLILAAAKSPAYAAWIDDAASDAASKCGRCVASPGEIDAAVADALEALVVRFGRAYLGRIPGRVSTQVDAALADDEDGTFDAGLRMVRAYEAAGVPRSRVLVKVAATHAGLRAAARLEALAPPVHVNVTLIFCRAQAVAAAQARATLVSPFVGRILDWTKRNEGASVGPADAPVWAPGAGDPGVAVVSDVFHTLKAMGSATAVMGASFRSAAQVLALAGIDYVTVSPALLDELDAMDVAVERRLDARNTPKARMLPDYLGSKAVFSAELASDRMASELLSDGITRFREDADALRAIIRAKIEAIVATEK